MAKKNRRKRTALRESKQLWLVSEWSQMPDTKMVRSAFVFAFHNDRLVMVRVNGTRYTLPGGRREACDKSIRAIVKREFTEEALGAVGSIRPLGYARVETISGKFHFLVYTLARVKSLDDFIASDESDARFEVPVDGSDPLLAELVGGEDTTSWKKACHRALLKEANKRRRATA